MVNGSSFLKPLTASAPNGALGLFRFKTTYKTEGAPFYKLHLLCNVRGQIYWSEEKDTESAETHFSLTDR